jgi:hypothetical protein
MQILLLPAHYRGKGIDLVRRLGASHYDFTILRALSRHEKTCGGDAMTPPTPTHDGIPGYVATYCKGCTRTPIKMK